MIELAHDGRGQAFSVPRQGTRGNVRKTGPSGTGVDGQNGRRSQLQRDTAADELREVAHPGRVPIAACGPRMPQMSSPFFDVQTAVVTRPEPASQIEVLQGQVRMLLSGLVEVSRKNTELAQVVVSQFGNMMESVAVLVRAVGEKGLPAKGPVPKPEGVAPSRGKAYAPRSSQPAAAPLHALVAQVMPALVAALSAPRADAAPQAADSRSENRGLVLPRAEEERSGCAERAHFDAVTAELSPSERALACALVEELGPAHRLSWLGELQTRPVADAVCQVRALLEPARAEAPVASVSPPPVTHKSDKIQPPFRMRLRNAVSMTAAKAMRSFPTRERMWPEIRSGLVRWGAYRRSAATLPSTPLAAVLRSKSSRHASDRARFVSGLAELSPPERAVVLTLAAELRGDHRRAWLRELATFPFWEAVAHLRALVAPMVPGGGDASSGVGAISQASEGGSIPAEQTAHGSPVVPPPGLSALPADATPVAPEGAVAPPREGPPLVRGTSLEERRQAVDDCRGWPLCAR